MYFRFRLTILDFNGREMKVLQGKSFSDFGYLFDIYFNCDVEDSNIYKIEDFVRDKIYYFSFKELTQFFNF